MGVVAVGTDGYADVEVVGLGVYAAAGTVDVGIALGAGEVDDLGERVGIDVILVD